ncbi:MAG: helix-turn-helix domain-containing protein [Planctomycetaceae bacterium]|nr:helix-turn-helix domain-containing protein [Planctomycetaceae bacterium]
MSHEFLSLDELALQLGRDRRDLEKLVARGRIPGHRLEGGWRFHPAEIRYWLEQEMRGYSSDELAAVEESQHSVEFAAAAPLAGLLTPELVEVPLEARTKRSVLESLLEVAGRTWQIWEPAALLEAIQEREAVHSTGFENGVAIPHPRNPLPQALGSSLVAYGRTLSGIPFGAPKRALSDVFFLVLCRDSTTHLSVLARLGRLLQGPGFLDELRAAADPQASYRVICDADARLSGTAG